MVSLAWRVCAVGQRAGYQLQRASQRHVSPPQPASCRERQPRTTRHFTHSPPLCCPGLENPIETQHSSGFSSLSNWVLAEELAISQMQTFRNDSFFESLRSS
ncbi:hypothetical protein AOLI_G00262320 [Acnodon oligacanthus]